MLISNLVTAFVYCYRAVTKQHIIIQGVQKVTQPMAYLESVSWTPHFEEIVASTISGIKPPRLLFMGASQG
jgi:hypothetical protein